MTTCQKGGKQNAQYIGQFFKDKVAEFDQTSTCTDRFFDSASNVQKAGESLCAKYPQAFCFHGSEQVLSFSVTLLISDQSKCACEIYLCLC